MTELIWKWWETAAYVGIPSAIIVLGSIYTLPKSWDDR